MRAVTGRRLAVMRLVVLAAFLALAVRLVWVQGFSASRYAAIGTAEVTSTQQVQALRGGIFDRNGGVLALSVPRSDVIADPLLIHDPAGEAAALAPVVGMAPADVQAKLDVHSGYVVVAREVDASSAARVMKLGLPGITLQADAQRVDPGGELAAPVLGMVGAEGTGLSGLEYRYDELLAGHDGSVTTARAPSGVALPGARRTVHGARPGTGLELTLDEPLQYVTEQALGAEVVASHARSGIAIVTDTRTGGILAMANLVADPTTGGVVEAPSNLAVTQVYEPGSVFKLATFAAALEAGVITPQQVFTVPPSITIDGWQFHDAEPHGTEQLSATEILAQSSNLGTIEIGQLVGKQRLAAEIAALGFGRATGLDFPGESAGIVRPPDTWTGSDMGSTPIGQDDAVTALQVLDMVNTIANGGMFVPPRLVRATVGPDGTVSAVPRSPAQRAVPAWVAAELTTMMEQVVQSQDGTAVAASVPGYTVAGKTGTAQIPDPKHLGYIPGAYMATFAGFAPAEHPTLSAIVVLERPTPIFGGLVAAPVFSQIMRFALHRYGVPTSPGGGNTGSDAQLVPFPSPAAPPGPGSPPPTSPAPSTATGSAPSPRAAPRSVSRAPHRVPPLALGSTATIGGGPVHTTEGP